MDEATKLKMLEQMTDETDQEVLSTYLLLAQNVVLQRAYPYVEELPETVPVRYDSIHLEIAAYILNKRGAEGETVHLENGVSRHWEDGSIPPSLLRRIVPMAGVV